jgi:pimeloyl-ACP methyl ester carboxylesterase
MTLGIEREIRTAKGARCVVRSSGPEDGIPLVWFHGATGWLDDPRFLDALGEAGFKVAAPEMPGFGASSGEDLLEDMLDFTLHGWDVVEALGLDRPIIGGHSMGGMIAAEMAAICPQKPVGLVLAAPNGLWDDELPIPDIFTLLPHQFSELLFADTTAGAALLTGGVDFHDMEALTEFFIGNSRRLGTAGKILFPLPERQLAKRLYRVTAPTLLVWGELDRYLLPEYADRWEAGLTATKSLTRVILSDVGHMTPHEAPAQLAAAVNTWSRNALATQYVTGPASFF